MSISELAKKLTRRDFLKFSGIVIGGLAVGGSSLAEASVLPSESDIHKYIIAPRPIIYSFPTLERPQGEEWEIKVNPKGFFDALEYTAWREEGLVGLNKLAILFDRSPISIEIIDNLPIWGSFIPWYWPGGSKLQYQTEYLADRYIDAKRRQDEAGRRATDWEAGYHETFHIWQIARNTLSSGVGTALNTILDNHSQNSPFEIEAVSKSWDIVWERNEQGNFDEFFKVNRIS